MIRSSLLLLAAAVAIVAFDSSADAGSIRNDCPNGNCQYHANHNPDLFYNYYAPANCGGVGAQMYISPLPVPAHVGHTYYTYQPLMPHEWMYKHSRTYTRSYDNGMGRNTTRVFWW